MSYGRIARKKIPEVNVELRSGRGGPEQHRHAEVFDILRKPCNEVVSERFRHDGVWWDVCKMNICAMTIGWVEEVPLPFEQNGLRFGLNLHSRLSSQVVSDVLNHEAEGCFSVLVSTTETVDSIFRYVLFPNRNDIPGAGWHFESEAQLQIGLPGKTLTLLFISVLIQLQQIFGRLQAAIENLVLSFCGACCVVQQVHL